MKDKIAIIGANDFQNQLILRAKELGYETHVFAWENGAIGKKNANYFYPISIVEKEKILNKCKQIRPVGICSIGSDLATITVNYVAEKLGLVGNPTTISKQCTNKYTMRLKLDEEDVKVPKFIKIHKGEEINLNSFNFPVIVKPTDRSGSRGVFKVENKKELPLAIGRAICESFEKCAVIEEFLTGEEYSCECISYNGEHKLLAITHKFTTGAPNFIETAHSEPSGLTADQQETVRSEVFKALTALGIQNGASHTEFKIAEDGNFGIVEVGARMGGGCIGSDLVKLSTGYDYVKMVIDIACGKEPDMTINPHFDAAHIHFILTSEDYSAMKKFVTENPEKIYRISEINESLINNVTDDGNRAGYYIFCDGEEKL